LAEDFAEDLAAGLADDFAAPFAPVSLDRLVDDVRLEAAALRVPLLALFAAPDFLEAVDLEPVDLEAVDLEAAFLAPPAAEADFFAPPALDAPAFAPELFVALFDADFAAVLPADLVADLPALLVAAFDAPPLLDFDVVAFAITTSFGEPLAPPSGHAHRQLCDDGRVPIKLKSTK
jgi:hypothetical protein